RGRLLGILEELPGKRLDRVLKSADAMRFEPPQEDSARLHNRLANRGGVVTKPLDEIGRRLGAENKRQNALVGIRIDVPAIIALQRRRSSLRLMSSTRISPFRLPTHPARPD